MDSTHQKSKSGHRVERLSRVVIFLALAAYAGMLTYGALVHSPTPDEPGHLVAGICHWELGRFELYRVNPPLVRCIATFPLTFTDLQVNWGRFSAAPPSRAEFAVGRDFICDTGQDAF